MCPKTLHETATMRALGGDNIMDRGGFFGYFWCGLGHYALATATGSQTVTPRGVVRWR